MKKDFYKAFEDRYRGSRDLILSRLQVYLDFLRPLAGCFEKPQAVDLGCGRGEFLEVLRSAGFRAHGVDLDEGMLEPCRQLGLSVEHREAVDFLRNLPAESQVAVSAVHVVEHLPFDQLRHLVSEALRVLKPGGLLILETPNPENLKVATHNFYYDPTHKSPIPPGLLVFVAEHEGFARVKILRLQESLSLNKQTDVCMAEILEGVSPDYSIVAQKGRDPDVAKALNGAFEKNYGVNMPELVACYDEGLRKTNQDLRKIVCEVQAEGASLNNEISGLAEQVREIAEDQRRNENRLQELASYLGQVQDMALDPWVGCIPKPISWPILLLKARKIRRPEWLPQLRKTEAASRPGFWRRLERSIRKIRKRLFGRIGFDRKWYLQEYPEVGSSGIEPLEHYIRFGIKEAFCKSLKQKKKMSLFEIQKRNRSNFWKKFKAKILRKSEPDIKSASFVNENSPSVHSKPNSLGIDSLKNSEHFAKTNTYNKAIGINHDIQSVRLAVEEVLDKI